MVLGSEQPEWEDAVPARSAENLQDQTRFGEATQMVSVAEASGRKVTAVSGNYAGELSDVHIDPTTGKIT